MKKSFEQVVKETKELLPGALAMGVRLGEVLRSSKDLEFIRTGGATPQGKREILFGMLLLLTGLGSALGPEQRPSVAELQAWLVQALVATYPEKEVSAEIDSMSEAAKLEELWTLPSPPDGKS